MPHRLLLTALLGLLVTPALATPALADVQVQAAWARATAPRAPTGAAYVSLANTGSTAERLVAASTPVAATVELHGHKQNGGVMEMSPVEALDLPAGQTVQLAPGGLHIMLMGLTAPLKQGSRFPLSLRLASGATIETSVEVLGAGAMGPAGHDAHHHHGG